MHCPNSTASGCRCPEHHPGLMAHSPTPADYALALELLRPAKTTLRVLTMPLDNTPRCDGTMVCPCESCIRERVTRRPRTIRQPWQTRRAA